MTATTIRLDDYVRPTPEHGLHRGVPALEYFRWAGASQSRLKILRDKSPAHVKWEMDHPQDPTDAMRLGAAFHTCVLEPDLFTVQWLRGPEGDGRTKGVKDAYAVLRLEHPDAGILKPQDYDTCLAMRDAVARHPHAKFLLDGEHECSAVWRDPATRVLCRGRFDAAGNELGVVTDLKSTIDASPFRFPNTIYQLGYHIQGAMYLRGAKALGLRADSFGIVAVEREPPYAVAVYQLNAAALYDGERELKALLHTWEACERAREWPAYPPEVVVLDLPTWAPRQINERLERMEDDE